jgi:hypothetical protein
MTATSPRSTASQERARLPTSLAKAITAELVERVVRSAHPPLADRTDQLVGDPTAHHDHVEAGATDAVFAHITVAWPMRRASAGDPDRLKR